MEYYVYAYLDPRTPPTQYGEYVFDYEPFYIGKGKGRRMQQHLRDVRKGRMRGKHHMLRAKIKSLLNCGVTPVIVKIITDLEEADAYSVEAKLVSIIGKRIDEAGPLTNIADGGIGSCTHSTAETRKARGDAMRSTNRKYRKEWESRRAAQGRRVCNRINNDPVLSEKRVEAVRNSAEHQRQVKELGRTVGIDNLRKANANPTKRMLASRKENGARLNTDPTVRRKMIEGRIRNCFSRAEEKFGVVNENTYNDCRYHSTPRWYSDKYMAVFAALVKQVEVV